jgi:hypothetical protein
MMDLDSLHALVSGAIWRAEQSEATFGAAVTAWAEVSLLEERLAEAIPVAQPEGRIARRGAVRAALKAQDAARAAALAARFSAEEKAPPALRSAMSKMLQEDARALAGRYRYAAKYHKVADARELARRHHAGGAFFLAA